MELGSEEVKAKLAELMLSVPEEPESMLVSGGLESILVSGGVWSGGGRGAAPVLKVRPQWVARQILDTRSPAL